jgi:low affinity Fe/Cu permease
VSGVVGSSWSFITAVAVIIIWAVTGPIFHFSDTWQLIINTGTTIVTFLMVFLMQNTQNRDTAAIQLKLDELIRANENARNVLLSLEDLTEEQLARVKTTFDRLRKSAPQVAECVGDVAADVEDEVGERGIRARSPLQKAA